jgi:hypothetical protein
VRGSGQKSKHGKSRLQLVKESRSGSKDEKRQLADLVAERPWSLTLRDFLKKVKSDYGFSGPEQFQAVDPKERQAQMPYLLGADGRTRIYLPGNLSLDDQLDEYVTASLCRRLGIPQEDFGLLPAETDEP